MSLSDIDEQLVYQSGHENTWHIDPRNQLRYHLQPRVLLDHPDPVHYRLVHFLPVTVIEPQRQQTQRILQRTALRQLYRVEEAAHRQYRVLYVFGNLFRLAARFALRFVEQDRFEIHVSPRVPRFVPQRIVFRRLRIALQNRRNGFFRYAFQGFLPTSQFQIAPEINQYKRSKDKFIYSLL